MGGRAIRHRFAARALWCERLRGSNPRHRVPEHGSHGSDRPLSRLQQWAVQRTEAGHFNKAAVAVANKLARVIWAVWTKCSRFDGNHLP